MAQFVEIKFNPSLYPEVLAPNYGERILGPHNKEFILSNININTCKL